MITVGRCPYCKNPGKERNEHHPIPTRFTEGKKRGEEDDGRTRRLDILFPEYFKRGTNNKKESICFECHRKVDTLIPQKNLMLPRNYLLLNDMLKNGMSIDDVATIKSTLNKWIEESSNEIKRRKEALISKKDLKLQ